MKVLMKCKKLLKPSTPTPTHLQKMKLSKIDQIQIPFYVGMIFHYQRLDDEDATVLAKLQSSLSETLSLYYHVAGRYNGVDCVIECNDQGIGYVEATFNAQLTQFVSDDEHNLVVGLSEFLPEPPLAVIQVSRFNCGGFIVAAQFNHMIGDMFTMSKFMNSWATACRHGIKQVAPPTFGLATLIPPAQTLNMPPPPAIDGVKFVSKRFVFNQNEITKLRNAAAKESKNNRRRPSGVNLVTAFLSKTLIKIECGNTLSRRSLMVHTMNLRKRTQLPLDKDICGNFFTVVMAEPSSSSTQSAQISDLADSLGTAVSEASTELANVDDGEVLGSMVVSSMREFFHEWGTGEKNVLLFSSWCRFPLYEVDFGWGAPRLVDSTAVPLGLVVLLDEGREGDGIAVRACLSEDDMMKFEQEQQMVNFFS